LLYGQITLHRSNSNAIRKSIMMAQMDRENVDYRRKVKCTLVEALRHSTGRTAHRGSRGIALLFHDCGTRREWGVIITTRPLFTPGNDPVPIIQEAGWASGPVWTGGENLAPTGIRYPDRSARRKSLYRLSYPAHDTDERQFEISFYKQGVWFAFNAARRINTNKIFRKS